jgi:hypothetical protein
MATKLLSDQLRAAVLRCKKTRYQISLETGISQSILSRFVNQSAGLSLDSIDKLCECIGLELRLIAETTKRK